MMISSPQRSLTVVKHQLNGTLSYNAVHACVVGALPCFMTKTDPFLVLRARGGGEFSLSVLAPEALQAHLRLPASPGFAVAAELPGPSFTS